MAAAARPSSHTKKPSATAAPINSPTMVAEPQA
ncbi:Uncharacterised protein [Mycobacterium tuberculosis]|nr:Uncharacterised protein [Mycobacterium tuberculosis]